MGPTVFGIECLETLLDFPIALVNELLIGAVGNQGLFERENVLGAIVTDQTGVKFS